MYRKELAEEKKFNPGDTALYKGKQCTVKHVYQQSMYYEARPIRSYITYRYHISMSDGISLYVPGEALESLREQETKVQ